MNQRYKTILKWVLYAALFLAVMLVQTMLLGRTRFFGVKLNLMPIVITCVAIWTGHEAGGLFGLLTALVWSWTGADDASLAIVSYTLFGVLAGWLCDAVFPRRFLPSMALCLAAVLLHELAAFLLKYYLTGAAPARILWVPITAGLSVLAAPVLYLLAKAIGKAGGN